MGIGGDKTLLFSKIGPPIKKSKRTIKNASDDRKQRSETDRIPLLVPLAKPKSKSMSDSIGAGGKGKGREEGSAFAHTWFGSLV